MTASTSESFSLSRQPLELRFRAVRLAAREWLSPEYVRVRLEGDELAGFTSLGSDDHIRVFFPDDAAGDTAQLTADELRAAPSRELTPLAWDAEAGWLDLEFSVHAGEGIAAPWAAHAELGAVAGVGGPRGSQVLTGRPDAWFLAGDETAVPAIRRFTQLMDAGAVGTVMIEVTREGHELGLETPAAVTLEYVYRGDAEPGSALAARLDAVTADERPPGEVFGFVAAEQAIVKPGRALLIDRWGLDSERVIVKGYWKRDTAEYHAPH